VKRRFLPFLLVACAKPAEPVVDEGPRLFGAACARCHGAEGRGGVAQGTMPAPRNFHDATFQTAHTDAELKETIRHGKGAYMPAFAGVMSDPDLDHLVAQIRSFGKAP
jgi:mono/diheme cytochrome c family protein